MGVGKGGLPVGNNCIQFSLLHETELFKKKMPDVTYNSKEENYTDMVQNSERWV
jgi:hypothetical protein